MMRRAAAAWWAHQRRLTAEWFARLLAAVIGRKRKPKPATAAQRRQRSRQTAILPPVIAPARTAISWLIGYSALLASALTAVFRRVIQAFRDPVEPRLRDYDDLIKSLNARRVGAGLPPAAENKRRDPTDEYRKPRPRPRRSQHPEHLTQQPSADPVAGDGEGADGAYELLPRAPDDNDGPGGGPRL